MHAKDFHIQRSNSKFMREKMLNQVYSKLRRTLYQQNCLQDKNRTFPCKDETSYISRFKPKTQRKVNADRGVYAKDFLDRNMPHVMIWNKSNFFFFSFCERENHAWPRKRMNTKNLLCIIILGFFLVHDQIIFLFSRHTTLISFQKPKERVYLFLPPPPPPLLFF